MNILIGLLMIAPLTALLVLVLVVAATTEYQNHGKKGLIFFVGFMAFIALSTWLFTNGLTVMMHK